MFIHHKRSDNPATVLFILYSSFKRETSGKEKEKPLPSLFRPSQSLTRTIVPVSHAFFGSTLKETSSGEEVHISAF